MMSEAFARNSHVATHPEAVALRAGNEALREELAKLITDRDYLTTAVLPAIEAEYNVKIGGLEYEAFTNECRVRRARRRLKLAQSYINRNERVPPASIESALDDEFSQRQAKIEGMRRGPEEAQAFEQCPRLSATATRELQTLYRRLAKRLHPDLNQGQTGRERDLWLQVADAYRDGALEELRALSLLLDSEPPLADSSDAQTSVLEALRHRRDDLCAHVERALAHLAHIKTMPPHALQQKLNDELWLATRAAELREKIALLKENCLALDDAYNQLTGMSAPQKATDDEEWPEFIGEEV
jgi:hypothetical protein